MEKNAKHALVTGATSGIGYELAKLLAKDNYNLILVARNEDNLRETAREMEVASGNTIHTHIIPIDLFEHGAAERIYTFTRDHGITVDILINDAGQGEGGLFTETALSRELDIIQLNIVALVSLTKYYLKEMVYRNRKNFATRVFGFEGAVATIVGLCRNQGFRLVVHRSVAERNRRHRSNHHGLTAQ